MKTFVQLRTEVSRLLQMPPDGTYASRNIRDYLNNRYRRIYDAELWPGLLSIASVTVSANSNTFTVGKHVGKVLRAFQGSRYLQVSLYDLATFADDSLPYSASVGSIYNIAPLGNQGVATQLSSNDTPKVVSDSASDTSVPVLIEGLSASNEPIAVATTVTGTTAVSVGTVFSRIDRVSKAKVSVGTISVKDSTEATTYATISPHENAPQYPKYRVGLVPPQDTTLTCVVKMPFVPFLNTLSVPFMEMDNALIYGAVADGWIEHRQADLAAQYEAYYNAELAELKSREIKSQATGMYPVTRA